MTTTKSIMLSTTNEPRDAPHLPTVQSELNLLFGLHRFFTYPNSFHVNVERKIQLSNSGFFLTHEKHSVQCFFCNLKIYDFGGIWNVNEMHLKLNKDCRLMKGHDGLGDIPIYDPTNYRYEAHRLYSMLTTTWNAPVTPYDLAQHGFYWTGSGDNCRCAFCRLEVRGWDREDTASGEHRRWNPNCVFMNHKSVGNVPMGEEITGDRLVHDEAGSNPGSSSFSINPFARAGSTFYGNVKYATDSTCSTGHGPRPHAEMLGVTPLNPPKHKNYVTSKSRHESYSKWPMAMPQRPEQLVEAGFYYTGSGDRVICFQCGGGLKDWASTDTPWAQHATWFSRCPYLLIKKGKNFVDETLKKNNIEMPIHAFEQALRDTLQLEKELEKEKEKEKNTDEEMEMEIEKKKDIAEEKKDGFHSYHHSSGVGVGSMLCRICMKKDIETVFLPCGHMVTCTDCVEKDPNCLRCSKPRIAYIRTFLS